MGILTITKYTVAFRWLSSMQTAIDEQSQQETGVKRQSSVHQLLDISNW